STVLFQSARLRSDAGVSYWAEGHRRKRTCDSAAEYGSRLLGVCRLRKRTLGAACQAPKELRGDQDQAKEGLFQVMPDVPAEADCAAVGEQEALPRATCEFPRLLGRQASR